MQHVLLQEDDREIGDAANHGKQQDAHEDHGRIRLSLAKGEKIAETGISPDELAHHDADHRKGRTDAQAGKQLWQR